MVYYCSVKGCKNNSKMKKKDPSIVLSFHAFPVKEATKQKWLRAIGRPSWDPPNFARICSAHFDLEHISHEGCRIRVMEDAYPVNRLPPNSNFEASDIEVCRICLATDLKMFSLQEGMLKTCLQSFAGLKENCSIEGLPQFICYECSARLINCCNLVEQCSIAQAVLLDLFTKNGQVSKALVKTQDRKSLGLESTLQCHDVTNEHEYKFYEEYSVEYSVNETDDAPKIKIEDSNRQIRTSFGTFNEIQMEHSQRDLDEELNQKSADYMKNEFNDDRMSEKDYVEVTNKIVSTKENPKFLCEECNINFASENARRMHILTSKQHRKAPDLCNPTPPNSNTACSKCGVQFLTTEELFIHLRAEHPRQKSIRANTEHPVKCEHCEEMMNNKAQHWLHVRLRHPDKKHSYRAQHNSICQWCGKLFQNSTKLYIHELRHFPATLRCVHCSSTFHDKYALSRHARTHARAMHSCALCARAFISKHNLTRHQRVHTGETPYSCNLCSKRFKHSTSQRLHVQSVHCNLPALKRNKIVI